MNIQQAKRFIKNNGIIRDDLFDYITSSLGNIYDKYCDKVEYEFSLNSKNSDVGLQYEPLYNFNKFGESFTLLKKNIFLFIYNFLDSLNKNSKAKFNLLKIKEIFTAVFGSDLLFIHVGFETSGKYITKTKFYFIPLHNLVPNFRSRLFSDELLRQFVKINSILRIRQKQSKLFLDSELNAFAVDFSSNGNYNLKIYKTYKRQNPNKDNNLPLRVNKEILKQFLNFERITDMDVMYRIPKDSFMQTSTPKIYFYPKPPLRIEEMHNNKQIPGHIKKLCRKYTSSLIDTEIYSISLEEKKLINIYVR